MVVFTIKQGGFATDGDGPKQAGCVKMPKIVRIKGCS